MEQPGYGYFLLGAARKLRNQLFRPSGFNRHTIDPLASHMIAPAKTPKDAIDELAGWFAAALKVPEVKAKLALQGLYPVGMCGGEFADFVPSLVDVYSLPRATPADLFTVAHHEIEL